MGIRTWSFLLGCVFGLSLVVLPNGPALAQCGTDPNGGAIPCPEGEKERKQRPTDIPASATFTPTPEPTITSTPLPTNTGTPVPTATFTPPSALVPPAAPKAPAGSAAPWAWLPLTGLALLLLLGFGFVMPRIRSAFGGGVDTDESAATTKGDKVKDTPRQAGPSWDTQGRFLAQEPGSLETEGDIGQPGYQAGRGISFYSSLEIPDDFTFHKDPVTADLNSGGPASELIDDSGAGILDTPGEADPLPDTVRDPLRLSGDPGSEGYDASEGLDMEGKLDLHEDFANQRDPPGATLNPGKATRFNPDPLPTRPTVDLEVHEADTASEPHRDPSRDGSSSGEADGESGEADATDSDEATS